MRIDNVRVLDVANGILTEPTTISFGGTRILAIGAAEERTGEWIDAGGATAVSGLINLHVHLSLDASTDPLGHLLEQSVEERLAVMEANALSTLRGGITSVRDLGCGGGLIFTLRRRVEAKEVAGPRIIAAGEALTRTGGHGAGWISAECDGTDGVRTTARQQLGDGADVLKVMATGGVMSLGTSPYLATYSLSELQTVVEEGRRENVSVAAHAEGREGIVLAVEAGVTTVEHGTYVDEAIAKEMIRRGAAWVPTISPHRFAERAVASGRLTPAVQRETLRSVVEAGRTPESRSITAAALAHFERYVRTPGLALGLGTDAGTTCVPHDDLLTEMEMFVEQGFTAAEVVRMATLGNAEILCLDQSIGSLEPGKLADIVIVDGNPLEDLSALRCIRWVFVDGAVVVAPDEPVMDGGTSKRPGTQHISGAFARRDGVRDQD